MKNKNIFIVLGIIAVIGVGLWYYFDKVKKLETATQRVMNNPQLREEARQRAAKNNTTVSAEAEKIAKATL